MRFLVWLIPVALSAADISPKTYLADVQYLASPELKGRATGSPEIEKAAHYIESQFRSFGLKPPAGKDYEQAFPVAIGAHLGPGNHMRYAEPGEDAALAPERDFVPFSFSSNGKLDVPVVFAGYGITDKEKHYDDYAGIDVSGKIVLILRHEPNEGQTPSEHASFAEKAVNAKMHGAKGVILINDLAAHAGKPDTIEKFARISGPSDAGVFFVQVRVAVASKWFHAEGLDLQKIAGEMNRDAKPNSFPMAKLKVAIDVDVRHDTATAHNVAAYLPGETAEYVVIGAHYDHLGLGGEFSLAPSQTGTVHPGADDNASGTAGVIELARWFSRQPKQKRGILFLTFAGEELGLFGSSYYVNHPILPLDQAVAMINMDMIGRIRDRKVYVGGVGTGTTFAALLKDAGPHHDFETDITERSGYGSSDHTSFTAKQVPVLFFFSGLHADYHKPSDTWDKIDAPAAVRLLDLVADVMDHLRDAPGRPEFVRVAETQPPVDPSSPHTGKVSGYGPDFGSIPDFTELPNGVRFADIRPGSPAAKADLRAGDILTEFDGKKIQNLYDFTYALRAKKPGQEVLVKVLRGGQTIEAKVLLTERR